MEHCQALSSTHPLIVTLQHLGCPLWDAAAPNIPTPHWMGTLASEYKHPCWPQISSCFLQLGSNCSAVICGAWKGCRRQCLWFVMRMSVALVNGWTTEAPLSCANWFVKPTRSDHVVCACAFFSQILRAWHRVTWRWRDAVSWCWLRLCRYHWNMVGHQAGTTCMVIQVGNYDVHVGMQSWGPWGARYFVPAFRWL